MSPSTSGSSSTTGHATSRDWQFWYVKPAKRGEYHTVYVTNGHRVTLYTKVK